MTLDKITGVIKASIATKEAILGSDALIATVLNVARLCTTVLQSGGKVIFCGNGGSFADAQHLSAEFTSRFLFDRPGLASIALGTNSSAMTAIGNDYGYENVFSREIESIAMHNDVVIAITTSGNSPNVIKAIEAAQSKNIPVIVFTGERQGKIPSGICTLNVPSTDTARIQESHILLGHIICELVEDAIFNAANTNEEGY